ncbi:MAG: Clp protease N-terminal domain-containing protein, partial [Pseudonocardiaceae bacterium]
MNSSRRPDPKRRALSRQLASAARRQQEMADLGEELLGYFVHEARTAGCSWSQIGTALGVSKQAAQQRHSALR